MPEPEIIFLYGTLMCPFPTQARLGVEHMLEYKGPDAMAGQLHDMGPYPALRPGPGLVQGQVFAILDPQVVDILDSFEVYRPGAPDESEYLRERWSLTQRPAEAWVYVFNRPVDGLPLIPGGDWAAYQTREGAAPTPWDDFFTSREVQ
ncbi:MAG: gamma-glutamylcyclotransferase [Desulfarculaceae bacterium]|nr:gamma-glutamylcyclotransferase [Desulfarculaceae bacterium]MCF8073596.1 gamma-glutamylcyclotransferase [Desulfarculaceae bacterium]MCF8103753.1 gamma-glutamylcyclotransferase [Desulfarculaceae bacterium]MCF8115688.1 gamma-glutamylcyclotransferase [Desulfarculaceae bacterium]